MRIRKLRCSFCRITEDQIAKLAAGPRLIVGPKLYICNECVAAANAIMESNRPPRAAVSRSILQNLKERCRQLLQRMSRAVCYQ
jgi:ATP-dependent protease Clp ATPase subunit